MEVDGDLEVLGIAVAAGALLHGGDLRVQALCYRIADAVAEVGQRVGQMPGNGLAAAIMGGKRLWVAQKYQRCQNRLAQPFRR